MAPGSHICLWEIFKTNFFSRTIGWIGTILGRDALQGTFLPSMVPIHPVVLEKKFVLHISHRVAMLNYVPSWWPILMIFFSDTTWRIELKCHE
jgi:hypothetical protein